MCRGRHAHPGGGLLPERPPSRTGVRLQGTVGPRPPGGAGHRPGEPHEVRAWLHGCVRQARVSRSLGASPQSHVPGRSQWGWQDKTPTRGLRVWGVQR